MQLLKWNLQNHAELLFNVPSVRNKTTRKIFVTKNGGVSSAMGCTGQRTAPSRLIHSQFESIAKDLTRRIIKGVPYTKIFSWPIHNWNCWATEGTTKPVHLSLRQYQLPPVNKDGPMLERHALRTLPAADSNLLRKIDPLISLLQPLIGMLTQIH